MAWRPKLKVPMVKLDNFCSNEITYERHKKATYWIGFAATIALLPFSINNFLQHRYLVASLILAVILIAVTHLILIKLNRFSIWLLFLTIVPSLTIGLVFVILQLGIIGVLWSFPCVVCFYVLFPYRLALIANIIFLFCTLPLAAMVLEFELVTRTWITLIIVSIFTNSFSKAVSIQEKKLTDFVVTDPLTGLLNRRLLSSSLEKAIEQYKRSNNPMTIISLDIDYFKDINDQFGHDIGDKVLHTLGVFLQQRFRKVDSVFRLGGEEFIILLYSTNLAEATAIAESLREEVSQIDFIEGKVITISLGVALLQENDDWEEWLKKADQRLYQAKENGRNQVAA